MKQIIEKLERYCPDNADDIMRFFQKTASTFTLEQWRELWEKLLSSDNEYMKMVFLWECMVKDLTTDKLEKYTEALLYTKAFNWEQKYYMHWQVVRLLFGKSSLGNDKINEMIYENYHNILHEFMNELDGLSLVNDRDDSLVLVTVQQFLDMQHGPTKTTLDRASVISRKLGKNVMIVNTAELYGGRNPGIRSVYIGGYCSELSNVETYAYDDITFPFIQFDDNMPNVFNAQEFINFVRKYKPSYIVNIGDCSLLIDACSKVVPVIDINTVPSGLGMSESTAIVIGRELKDSDSRFLEKLGKTTDYIIRGRFTSSLKEQTHTYTRSELGIPEERFVIAVVGGRLRDELDNEFLDMLEEILNDGALLCIIGNMENYYEVCEKRDVIRKNSIYLGMQDDVLAIFENCDLYVNPKRKGGGTSVIEAMSKGIPAVTLDYGDVALGAGKDFCVKTYEEMKSVISEYISNEKLYNQMSLKARERAEYMLDSDTAFTEILGEFEKRYLAKCN